MIRYLVQLADRTSFYLSEKEGKQVMTAWSLGENIFCRKGAYAHYLISSIRPVEKGNELYQDCIEQEEIEQRRKLIHEGKLKIIPRKDEVIEEKAIKMLENTRQKMERFKKTRNENG